MLWQRQQRAVSLHHDVPACLVYVLLMDPLSKRLCDSAVFTVLSARHFKQYAVHKLLWPFTLLVFVMAYRPVHHAVHSFVFNPAQGYRTKLIEQKTTPPYGGGGVFSDWSLF
ncbi:hypothetical protein P3S34_25240, partial [Enterobacter hormaechei]|uniref:hypothetical protein n=1 Tax=Enterobacter hormaechei TaxID=158836 RepID=UPI0023E40E4F